jgi:hypothetical protein
MLGFEKKGIWSEAGLTVWGFIVFFLSNFKISTLRVLDGMSFLAFALKLFQVESYT